MKRQGFIIIGFVMALILALGGLALADYPPEKTIKWKQLPDPNGYNVNASFPAFLLGDDFLCTQTGPIWDVHIWESFLGDNGPTPN